MHHLSKLPEPQRDWALFLDLDGTIVDIAPTPGEVVVPIGLLADLEVANFWLDGALAVVSGRKLNDLERLLAPLELHLAAEHGAILRTPASRLPRIASGIPVSSEWLRRASFAVADWPGVFVEEKSYGFAVHFRGAPEREHDVEHLLQKIVSEAQEFEILPARMAFELRYRGVNKGDAVRQLMLAPPFCGRVPVFIGDDVTDEEGFREAEQLNGYGLHVKQYFGGDPANVRRWLRCFRG